MAIFPALTPSAAPITPGAWAVTTAASLNGAESRIRQGSAQIGRRLQLTFTNISEADFLAIVSHYRGQRSGFDAFGFDLATLAADLTPSGHAWLYASPPQVVDDHADCFTVACEFRCEPRGLVVARGKTWRTPATFLTNPTARGVNWVTASTTFARGSVSVGALNTVLLLHMDGSNGSTTFTDSSTSAHTMTVNLGTVTISTADSMFGGASANFSGGDLRTPISSDFTFDGDFTVEMWAKRTGTTGTTDTLASGSNELTFMIRASSDTPGVWLNSTRFATGLSLTLNTWHHIAVVRIGSTATAYKDGVSIGTATITGTVTCGRICLGNSITINNRFFRGLIDEARVAKVGIYSGAFTPSGPFPNP